MAEEFLSPIDMLLDENNTDNIKLYNEDNQEVEFEQIAHNHQPKRALLRYRQLCRQ